MKYFTALCLAISLSLAHAEDKPASIDTQAQKMSLSFDLGLPFRYGLNIPLSNQFSVVPSIGILVYNQVPLMPALELQYKFDTNPSKSHVYGYAFSEYLAFQNTGGLGFGTGLGFHNQPFPEVYSDVRIGARAFSTQFLPDFSIRFGIYL